MGREKQVTFEKEEFIYKKGSSRFLNKEKFNMARGKERKPKT